MFWVAGVILFFVIVLSRRWIAEAVGMPWSPVGSFVLGFGAYLGVGILTCSHKWTLLAGIVGAYVGAYFGGVVTGDSGGGY